jgi:hypothetical protein
MTRWLVLGALLACHVDSWDPPERPTTAYPCGVFGVVCGGTGMCCPEYFVCGGSFPNVGCPAGQCCDVGSPATFGARRMTPQLPAAAW